MVGKQKANYHQPRLRGLNQTGFSRQSKSISHTYHQLYFHFIWATHSRAALIERSWRADFLRILNEEVKTRGGLPLRHNAMPDHVHLLVRLRPATLLSEFIGQVKGASAFRGNKEINPRFKLKWQEGYGVVSLRGEECEKVSRYIDNQEEHHRSKRLSETLETIGVTEDDWLL